MKYLKVKEVAGILNISYRKVLDQIHMGNCRFPLKVDPLFSSKLTHPLRV